MIKWNKNGFSLIEVMLLLVVFSVILAAAMPIMSRKSKPMPKNVRHGVYRCIAQNNGRYLQEYYNAYRQLKTEEVNQCTFNPPNASNYQIDYYTAGAGGTKFAQYRVIQDDDSRSVTIDRDKMIAYAENNDKNALLSDNNGDTISYEPTEQDFLTLLNNLELGVTNVLPNGADGGDATLTYRNAYNIICKWSNNNAGNAGNDGYKIQLYQESTGRLHIFDETGYVQGKGGSVNIQTNLFCPLKYYNNYNGMYPYNIASMSLDELKDYPFYINNPNTGETITQRGGRGGRGGFLNLVYRVDFDERIRAHYTGVYPIVKYVAELINQNNVSLNGTSNSFAPAIMTPNGNNLNYEYGYAIQRPANGENASHNFVTPSGNPFTINADNLLLQAENGKDDVNTFPGFFVPNYSTFRNTGAEMVLPQRPGPGTGGRITIITRNDSITQNFINQIFNNLKSLDPGSRTLGLFYIITKDFAWTISYTPGTNGNKIRPATNGDNGIINSSVHQQTHWPNVTPSYSISAADIPFIREPVITMSSDLAKKEYQIGQAGRPGLHKKTSQYLLGDTCTLRVPHGGPVLDMNNLLPAPNPLPAGFNSLTNTINTYESNLAVGMTCHDSKGIVYEDNLEAHNRYIPDPTNNWTDYTFKWSREYTDENPFTINAPAPQASPVANLPITSLWSKIYNIMAPLSNFNVGNGGRGTTLVDRCTVPKGGYNLTPFVRRFTFSNREDVLDGSEPQIILHDTITINERTIKDEQNGMIGGYNCYNNNTYNIGSNAADRDHYELSAQQGGGGAIVIKW